MHIYIDYISQPSRTVLAFCQLSNIPVVVHEIRVSKLQHMTEEYARINPMKKVPALVDGELRIGESHAIVDYLIRKYKLEEQWCENDILTRAKVQEYLHYHHTNTRKCAMLLFSQLFSKLYPVQGQTVLPSKIGEEVMMMLEFLEEHYFRESAFMIGKKMTVADLAAYFEIQSLELLDQKLDSHPKIMSWLSAMGANQGVKKVNEPFNRMVPKMRKLRSSL